MREPIRKFTRKDGTTVYRLVVDAGRHPDGRRRQITKTFAKLREARSELARIRRETDLGTYIAPSEETISTALDAWLLGALRDRRASTRRNYVDALQPVRDRIGHIKLQQATKADVEGLVDWMLTSGRRRGGPAGSGLSGRTVRLTLGRLTAALDMAVAEGKIARNPARLVRPPRHIQREREPWSGAEVKTFLAAASADRLHAAWRLSLYGLRRGEVLGLRWADIDLPGKILTVTQSRVLVNYQVRIEEPKSRNGLRTLPLDDALVDALKSLRKRQAQESADAGPAYTGGEYVVTNVLGEPVHPEWYSDEFGRLLKHAGLRRITLHDSRHTTLTLMEHAGVPISVISKWAGHYDSSFTQRTYVHASGDDLKKGRQALARIHKIG
jgi:integrase